MVILYTVFYVDLNYLSIFNFPALFHYPVNVHQLICYIIPGHTYSGLFTYPVIFTYTVKILIFKCAYLLK